MLLQRALDPFQMPGKNQAATSSSGSSFLKATPMKTNRTPIPTAIAATPKATTDVNNEARRNDEVMAVSRSGSSLSNSA